MNGHCALLNFRPHDRTISLTTAIFRVNENTGDGMRQQNFYERILWQH